MSCVVNAALCKRMNPAWLHAGFRSMRLVSASPPKDRNYEHGRRKDP